MKTVRLLLVIPLLVLILIGCKKNNDWQEDGTVLQFNIPKLGENSYDDLSVFVVDVVKVTIQ